MPVLHHSLPNLPDLAADGFPIYSRYDYIDSHNSDCEFAELKSRYQRRSGSWPEGASQSGGYYDATFVDDYELVSGRGGFDKCNGRFTVTPEIPDGIYTNFLSSGWPLIPRCFRGESSTDFSKRR